MRAPQVQIRGSAWKILFSRRAQVLRAFLEESELSFPGWVSAAEAALLQGTDERVTLARLL